MSDSADMLLLMTTPERTPDLAQITDAREVTPELRRQLIDCWIAVTNSGGAAGFPFPPVQDNDVAPVADKLLGRLHRNTADSSPPDSTTFLPDGLSSTTIPTGSSGTGARSTTFRPTPSSAGAVSAPPSCVSCGS